jgi:hypothetical protein
MIVPLREGGATAHLVSPEEGESVARLDGVVRVAVPVPLAGNRVIRFTAPDAGGGAADVKTESASVPLMRSGRVTLLGTSRSGRAFESRAYEIVPGERVERSSAQPGDTVPWSGLVIADERPGLTITLATRGTEVLLRRGNTPPYRLSASYLDRLRSDPSLVAVLLAAAFLAQVIAGILGHAIQRRLDPSKAGRGQET